MVETKVASTSRLSGPVAASPGPFSLHIASMVSDADLKKIVGRLSALSDREHQITNLACDGLSNKAIASRLGLSEGTVKIHLYNIYKKLGISNRNVLVAALALSRGRSEDR